MKRSVETFIKQQGIQINRTIKPQQSIAESAEILISNGLGASIVCENGFVHGIVTEHDIVKYIAENISIDIEYLCIKDIMTQNIIYGTLDYTLEQCLLVMTKMSINYLPILDENSKKFLALINIRQISSVLVDDQEHTIQELTRYISGASGVIHEISNAQQTHSDVLQFNINSILI